MNCGEFHEEFSDGGSIILPPVRKCDLDGSVVANQKEIK
jgi:hypothetical protein